MGEISEGTQPLRSLPSFLFNHIESKLRKAGRLEPDDRLIELRAGTMLYSAYDGRAHQAPPRRAIKQIGCAYSSRRLFFGGDGRIVADLGNVWFIEARGIDLAIIYSSPEFNEIRWRWRDSNDPSQLAQFVDRLESQRLRRLAEWPDGGAGAAYRTVNEAVGNPAARAAAEDVWSGHWSKR